MSLEDIAANQTVIINNQPKIIYSLAQLQASVDYMNNRALQIDSGHHGNMSAVQSDDFFKPVETVEMLNDLEQSLHDDTIMTKYVKAMSHICGTTGKEEGIDCCYSLIDHFVTRQFLVTCSWTGMSRDNAVSEDPSGESEAQMKIPFMTYRKVRQLFLKLVLQADSGFTFVKCDEFFKRVLKNSKQRLLAKTVSKHKNRPKNLHYSVRQQEAKKNPQ